MYKAPRKNDYMQECKKVRTTNRTPFTGGSSSYAVFNCYIYIYIYI